MSKIYKFDDELQEWVLWYDTKTPPQSKEQEKHASEVPVGEFENLTPPSFYDPDNIIECKDYAVLRTAPVDDSLLSIPERSAIIGLPSPREAGEDDNL